MNPYNEPQPLPVVEPIPKPTPQPQPGQQQIRRSSGWLKRMFPKVLQFLFCSGCLSFIWFGIISQVGSITGNLKFDLFLWAMGILSFFYSYILTDEGVRWAEKYCGLWGRKGR